MIVPTANPGSAFLSSGTDFLGVPRWSPSGRAVLRSAIDGSTLRKRLVLTPVDGSPESILLETDPANGLRPVSWFPDGDSLIFIDVRTGIRVLRLSDLSTRAHTPLTDWIEPSPSGRFGIEWEVDPVDYDTKKYWRLYDLSTGQLLRAVTHPRGLHRPAWSPDEAHFADLCQELTPGLEFLGLCVYDRATLMPITRLADPTPETVLDYPRWIP
jgi:Tol biopolymer transport system component